MPDQPDDAQKRHQRGVFPPFFAPRSGGGESLRAPTSGSWRRVSRLFTPPEGTRQRGSTPTPQAPATEPSVPAAQPSVPATEPSVPATEALGASPSPAEDSESGGLRRFDPMAFDVDAEELVVQSLESEPISLAIPDLAVGDDESPLVASTEETLEGVASMGEEIGSIGRLRDYGEAVEALSEVAPAAIEPDIGESRAYGEALEARSEVAAEPDIGELRAYSEAVEETALFTAAEATAVPETDADPWEGAELPEPAFGSIGWPSTDPGTVMAPSEPAAARDDEMSAALGWSDADPYAGPHPETGVVGDAADDTIATRDDALSGVVDELRHSSSGWKSASDEVLDEDAEGAARARFFSSAEPVPPPAEASSVDPADRSTAADIGPIAITAEGVVDTGAAIADALARVAARIRSGDVTLASEAIGSSDESALAAALAALLRGPPR